ncbi:unnamed protein product [Amoebophrya sp. A120]|nr:unnamed protein product [Amoebophrya sp. A120]|eukprot:GSA120T00004061001.1
MPSFGDSGVSWECVAREFRAKYTGAPAESASLKAANAAIDKLLPEFKKIPGLKEVKRAVCGECGDIKLVISVLDDKFGDWAGTKFAPEEALLAEWKAIDGISAIETQNMTFATL